MSAFILRRVLLAVPTLFGVLVVAFLLLYVAPGDPVESMVGERADSATISRLRAELRLDDPLPMRFGHYVTSAVTGDLGRSYITNRPIAQDIRERFPKTLQLAGAAMLMATLVGITLGILSARRPGGIADRFALGIAYLGISFPVYWVGLLLILLFAVTLKWLPPSGYGSLRFLVLPALTLGMRSIAFLARMTRSAMMDALSADYVRTARAKGLNERTRHGSARTPERAHSDHHRDRPRLRSLPHGQHPDRDDLFLARHWPLCRERDLPSRSSRDSGHGVVSQHGVRARQPHHRPGVREGRSARQLRMTS